AWSSWRRLEHGDASTRERRGRRHFAARRHDWIVDLGAGRAYGWISDGLVHRRRHAARNGGIRVARIRWVAELECVIRPNPLSVTAPFASPDNHARDSGGNDCAVRLFGDQ